MIKLYQSKQITFREFIFFIIKTKNKIMELDHHLKLNGLFIIDHADYFFEDTEISSHYYTLKGDHNIIRERYMFHKYNQKLEHICNV